MKKNEGGQVVAFQAVSSTDGSAVTTGSPTVYVTIDGGTQATGTNTAIHEGQGSWSYVPTQAETNGDHIVYTFTLSGCINQSVNVYPVVVTEYQATGFSTFDHTTDEVTTDAASRTASQADVSGLATQASVDTVDANVDAILVDTNDLQTNQGNWLTATGFSTFDHTTDEVTTDAASRTASQADVSLLATQVSVDTVSSNVDAVLIDSDELQSKLIPMLEPDGFGNFQYTALALENAPSGGGGGGDATLANQTAIISTLSDMSGATFDTSTDSLEAIRDRGDAAWVTGGGGGGIWQLTVTVTDTSANAVQGARVAVDGTSLTVTTDTSGEAVLNLNDGGYTLNISAPSGYDDPAAQSVTISGADGTLAVSVSGGGSCEIPPL